MPTAEIDQLIAGRRPWRALDGAFYADPAVYQAELDRIWGVGWLFAAHACELPEPGSFVRLEVGNASVLVTRDRAGQTQAMHNVCRHRGSRVCVQERGCAKHFVCPYHQWAYEPDGSLRVAPGMGADELGGDLGLRPVRVREVGGLVFVSLADSPPPFHAAAEGLDQELTPHALDRAKIATEVSYTIEANWKLVLENNRECYHCPGSHPEYCQANFDVARDRGSKTDQIEAAVDQLRERLGSLGLPTEGLGTSSAMTNRWCRANRTPNSPGFVTESLDGRPVSVPMGGLPTVDVGTARLTAFPNFWCHASGDHAMTTRLLPDGPDRTIARICWLVDADAREGRDYEVERLTPFWQRTSEQDWEICRRQHAGVMSPAYTPGPLSQRFEPGIEQFIGWYLDALAGRAEAWD